MSTTQEGLQLPKSLQDRMAAWNALPEAEKKEREARILAQQAEEDRRRKQNKADLLFLESEVPLRHTQCVLDDNAEWRLKFAMASKMVFGPDKPLVALIGLRGNGKTQMAVELIRESTTRLRSALFTSAVSFFMSVKATFAKDASEDEEDVLARYGSPFLLVIDEIGKRGGSDWENNLLFELLNRRYNNLKPTVLIDNRTRQEFIETIGPSLASRMTEGGGIIECNWPSFRKATT